jgi:ionotropic kainate glutamate receptor 2
MYTYMIDNADEVLLEKNEDGVRKVQQENYAYLMESTSIEYIKQRKCNVTQVGGLLDDKGYGIAMRKGWSNHQLCNNNSEQVAYISL